MWIAAGFDKREIVKLLLENGANANILNNAGSHMVQKIIHAIQSGEDFYAVLDIILPYVDEEHINHQDGIYGRTLLHSAIKFGNLEIVKKLLDMGANLYKQDKDDKYPLDMSFRPEIIDYVLNKVLNNPQSKFFKKFPSVFLYNFTFGCQSLPLPND